MKKYQKLIKDNIDFISKVEFDLFDDIDVVHEGYLSNIYIASGALELIDESYNFDKLPMRISEAFANIIFVYAASAPDGRMSHEHKMHCFDLSKDIKNNLHWHRMREPFFNN